MRKCCVCGLDYPPNPKGGILLSICSECLAAPKSPDGYVSRAGILVPNPEWQSWRDAEDKRLAELRSRNKVAA